MKNQQNIHPKTKISHKTTKELQTNLHSQELPKNTKITKLHLK